MEEIGAGLSYLPWPVGIVDAGGDILTWLQWGLLAALGVVSLVWVGRVLVKERHFVEQLMPSSVQAAGQLLSVHQEAKQDRAEATFTQEGQDSLVCLATPGRTLLEVAEANEVAIQSGCPMGMCGSDPLYIVEGRECLAAASTDEQDTLKRLGLSTSWRMACMARVQGPVTVSPTAAEGEEAEEEPAEPPSFDIDTSVQKVVIIGNGVAGATAADDIRRYNPDCEITIVARGPYAFYNRMAVSKLIYEGTDMEQISLMPPDWSQKKRVETLLGSRVESIDPERRVVATDRGRFLPYDRLLLATGH